MNIADSAPSTPRQEQGLLLNDRHIGDEQKSDGSRPILVPTPVTTGRVSFSAYGRWRRKAPIRPPAQFPKVLQDLMSPLFKPAVSHCWRWADEPWVKLSGTA